MLDTDRKQETKDLSLPRKGFIMGVDLGQAQDFTAVVVLEREERETVNHFTVRHLERLPLGTPYPEQVRHIKALYDRLKDDGHKLNLVVDGTGVGRAVVDMLTQARLPVTAISITGGDTVTREGRDYRVPKRDLASVVQVLLQTGHLKIDKTLLEASILTAELQGFKYSITASGHTRFGNDVAAWREAAHDDLVLATAVACWYGERRAFVAPTPIVSR